jgi:DNA-binding NarL/FixJ family response regulator
LVRSADALIVRAPESAVLLLRRALSTAGDEVAGVLRFHLVRALLWAGALVEAEHTALAALATAPDPAREGTLRWLLARARYRQGRPADAVAVAEEALRSPYLTPAEVARFHGFAALSFVMLGRFDESEAAARKALAAGEECGDALATLYAYDSMAVRRLSLGDLVQSLHFSERALAVLEAGNQPDLEVKPYIIRGYCLMGLDRLAEADDALASALRRNHRAGGVHLPLSYAALARLRFLDGRWDDALAEVQAGLDGPDPYHFAAALLPLTALVSVHRGAFTPGTGEAGELESCLGHKVFSYLTRWAMALAKEARGNPRQALDLLYPAWEKPGRLQPHRVTYDICPDLARLAASTGDTGRARCLATTTEALTAWEPSPSMSATALLCRGMAAADPGPLLEAARCFREAGRPLYEGYGYEEAAALLAGQGRTAEAREALDSALVLYAGLDAVWDIDRAQGRLRRAGVRRGRRQALRKRPTHGWEALTETELKVAGLVAEGLSNPDIATRMFLSRRTVQSHVSSVLAKLGLSSRVEVAIDAHRRTPA